MKVCAVICEFNPFHNGHKYIIDKMKENSESICIGVMSGNYVERGLPAIFSKYDRAKIAIDNGADLILELPFPFSIGNAELFAYGAISLIHKLNIVDELYFGCECDNIETLTTIATNMNSKVFSEKIKENINHKENTGLSYFNLYESIFGKCDELRESNNILAISYIRELLKLKSTIKCVPIKRVGSEFNSNCNDSNYASATYIRNQIINGPIDSSIGLQSNLINKYNSLISNGEYTSYDKLFNLIRQSYILKNAISNSYENNEEIFNRINKYIHESESYDNLVDKVKTKKYSQSKINRAIISSVLKIKNSDFKKVKYSLVLGVSEAGRKLVRKIKDSSCIPILATNSSYTKIPSISDVFNKQIIADEIWASLKVKTNETKSEFNKKTYIKE